MKRREFLRQAGVASSLAAFDPKRLLAQSSSADRWRAFEIVTRVEVLQPAGLTRVWLPTPLAVAPYQKTLGDTYRADGGTVQMVERPEEALDMLVAEWPDGIAPILKLTSRVATTGHAADLTQPSVPPPPDLRSFAPFLRPTRLLPITGIVKTTSDEITKGAGTDFERARAIYDWVVDHTFSDPKVRGGGVGDIRFMLESKSLGGKCADLNALFVGLCRAAGVPAREIYGLRVAPSQLGMKSLGLTSENATRAQHCRAEVYLTGYGWVPVDPADVRKAALEEPPGNLPVDDERVSAARKRLFGSWEMNWAAFNYAADVSLPGARHGTLPYFMYPQAETASGRVDCLDPDGFQYEITVRPTSEAA